MADPVTLAGLALAGTAAASFAGSQGTAAAAPPTPAAPAAQPQPFQIALVIFLDSFRSFLSLTVTVAIPIYPVLVRFCYLFLSVCISKI